MALKYLINGYFRSGTTYLWKSIRDNNPGLVCFYEPLHPFLFKYLAVNKGKKKSGVDQLHGHSLWNEYCDLNESSKKNLRLWESKVMGFRSASSSEIIEYLRFYDNLDDDVFLQPNRLHLYLDHVSHEFDTKIVHVVRNSKSVVDSIILAYLNENKSFLKKIKRFILGRYGLCSTFEVDADFSMTKKFTSVQEGFYDKCLMLFKCRCVEKVIVNWIVFNYFGMKSMIENKGLIFFYEEFYLSEIRSWKRLADFLDVNISQPNKFKRKGVFIDSKWDTKVKNIAKKYNIEYMLVYIEVEASERNVSKFGYMSLSES